MSAAEKWAAGLGAVSSLGAAGFWLRASLIPVPDNQDTFIAALQRASRVNAIAAAFAAAASMCAAYAFINSIWG
jgi:hypothetical protein